MGSDKNDSHNYAYSKIAEAFSTLVLKELKKTNIMILFERRF